MSSVTMEAFNYYMLCFFTLAIMLLLTIFIRINQQKRSKPGVANLPPGPRKLPILGNLHQMVGDQPHRRLRDLAHKYGPDVMQLQLGEVPHIVISTPEAAKLVMKTHDLAFASRPSLLASNILCHGSKNISFAPYGEYWRQMRKVCTLELFSAKRVRSFRHIREEEVASLVASLSGSAGTPVNLRRMLFELTSTVTSRAAFGKAQELTDDFMMVVDNISDVLAGFRIHDLYPSVKFLPVLTGFKAKLDKMCKASDSVLDHIIDNHKSRRFRATESRGEDYDGDEEDLVDVLLNLQESNDLGVPITTEVIKAVTLEMFLAGIDTSTTLMEWSMSEMVQNPRVLQRAQQEVRHVFGGGFKNSFEEANLGQSRYLDMIISESLRLHPLLPLLVPRISRDHRVKLDAYEVPINTSVIVNAWAINRDSRHWAEPEAFYPERFMDCSIEYNGTNFQFIPFGAGRRMCPGVSLGLAIVKLALASLLFHFDWTLPDGRESVDMKECFGLTLRRRRALHLIPVPYNRA